MESDLQRSAAVNEFLQARLQVVETILRDTFPGDERTADDRLAGALREIDAANRRLAQYTETQDLYALTCGT